jgi:hypothetical protein
MFEGNSFGMLQHESRFIQAPKTPEAVVAAQVAERTGHKLELGNITRVKV